MAAAKKGLAHRLYTGEVSYDFVKNRNKWYIISAIVLLISIATLLIRGLDLGIEFRGGSDFQVKVPAITATSVQDMRQAVVSSGVPTLDGSTITTIGSDRVRIQTRSLSVAEQSTVRQAIGKQAGTPEDQVTYQMIGASWGQQVTQKAAFALVVFVVLVALLMAFYFRDWKMSVAAMFALAHDLVLTVGIYAVVGFTVTPATLIGVLTILGYSLYDTVVVFDKVRENVAEIEKRSVTYSAAANMAVNQVLVRSFNTTLIGVLPVAALLFAGAVVLGSGPLEDLGLALFVGMIVGAYSSLVIATPLLAQLKEREPAMREHRARLARRKTKDGYKALDPAVVPAGKGAPMKKRGPKRDFEPENSALAAAEAAVAGRPTAGWPLTTEVPAVSSLMDDPDDIEDDDMVDAEAPPEPARTPPAPLERTERAQPTRNSRNQRRK